METAGKEKWVIDPTHSEIGFKIKHLMITNVKGSFRRFDASIYTTGDDFRTAEADVWIDVTSIDTGNADRDGHVQSPDFFDTANHPQIHFVANTVEPVDQDGSFDLWGDLTIRGITKRVKFNVEFGGVMKDPWGNEKAGFTVNGTVNRKDFGLTWNAPLEAGGFLVSDIVYISCELQLMRGQ
jgi:hypothetical protein